MNRKILFRGKRKDNGEWVKGSLLILESGYYIVPIETFYNEIDITKDCTVNAIWEEQDFFEVIPETVSQYTGLDDKDGVKIFEADIVKFTANRWYNVMQYPIVYNTNQAKFVIDAKLKKFGIANGNIEVIGNIHDNPELLDEEVK